MEMITLALLCFTAVVAGGTPYIQSADSPFRVQGQYNVVLKPFTENSESTKTEKLTYVTNTISKIEDISADIRVVNNFIFKKLIVLIVHCEQELTILKLFDLPEIQEIVAEEDQPGLDQSCEAEQTGSTIWGLSRIATRIPPDYVNGEYSYLSGDGTGSYLYLLDSGIYVENVDFGGRAVHGYTVASLNETEGDQDLNGHGTHCAGTVMGTTYGVAKQANAIAVKIINKDGTFTTSAFVEGTNWIFDDFTSKAALLGDAYMAVASMSLGGGPNPIFDSAVEELIGAGLPVVVSARNYDASACDYSPARVAAAVTTAASDQSDVLASFSNWGPCVNIIAPGVSILSDGIGSPNATATKSGTSMAVPHVAGTILRYQAQMGRRPPPSEIMLWLTGAATQDAVDLRGEVDTPNLLLYAPCALTVSSAAKAEQNAVPEPRHHHHHTSTRKVVTTTTTTERMRHTTTPLVTPSADPTTTPLVTPSRPSADPSTPSLLPGLPSPSEWHQMQQYVRLTYHLALISVIFIALIFFFSLIACIKTSHVKGAVKKATQSSNQSKINHINFS